MARVDVGRLRMRGWPFFFLFPAWCFVCKWSVKFVCCRDEILELPISYNLTLNSSSKNMSMGTSLVVQCLKLYAASAGELGSIPGQETTSCMPTKDPTWCAAAKTWHSQINKEVKIKKKQKHEHDTASFSKCKFAFLLQINVICFLKSSTCY